MTSVCQRIIPAFLRNRLLCSSSRCTKATLPDSMELATGLEKRELQAKLDGNYNPFDYVVIQRENGTKNCPIEIPSAFECRLVGCICEDLSTSVNYMWIYKGIPKRCECGYWFKLKFKCGI
ncbi:unnamed protein product [Phyllotreta striolata]|uniref:Cytochrome c oxidase subunit 5B, mitochondrial n=1 Tax=Phyllotreta striolata TaxID=444603 RepID=A0A9N9THS6_PHYSR|nr:unnamed protein product [Phyllotreta striolata]